jgi:hypothetical protein
MPSQILNNADWVRTAEVLYRGKEFTGVPFKASYTLAANPIRPGFVAVIRNGAVELADTAIDNGAFMGIFLSERTTDIDESNGGTIPPVIVTGPGTMKILNAALDSGSTYALSATGVVELVAVAGKLVPRGAQTGPTVAHLLNVAADGIIVELLQPNSISAAGA